MRIDEIQPHTPFVLEDYWSTDAALRQTLGRYVTSQDKSGQQFWPELNQRLSAFSKVVHDQVRPLAKLCDRPNATPRLVQFNEWGQRVDGVETGEGWRRLNEWQVNHGVVGESYPITGQENYVKHAELGDRNDPHESAGGRSRLGHIARMYNIARLFMFSPESQVVLCPTSMSDGAVRVLELYGTAAQKERYLPRLLSRNFSTNWQAGQWMTEVAGGSDVSMTETVARPLVPGQKPKSGDPYVIHGFKWFSSAIDGHMSLALARTDPDLGKGSKGLSLFLIPLHKTSRPEIPPNAHYVDETAPTSKFNGIRVHRLKSKLGTQHVPTAELELCGAVGELIGEEGRGVAQIAQVLNITRVHSANNSVSSVGRALHIIQSYSNRRSVGAHGGSHPVKLRELPMHNSLISGIAVTYRALLQLHWKTTLLVGKSEMPPSASSARDSRRLRLLTPVDKGFASVRASECLPQSIECMGGQGYMQENQLTTLLRDDLVSRIWEGTPSVLSLDVARVHAQSKGLAYVEWIEDSRKELQQSQACLATSRARVDQVNRICTTLFSAIDDMENVYIKEQALIPNQAARECLNDTRLARVLLDLTAIVECGVQLLQQAAWSSSEPSYAEYGDVDLELHVAYRWACGPEGRLAAARTNLNVLARGEASADVDRAIAYEERLAHNTQIIAPLHRPAGTLTSVSAHAKL